MVHCLKQKIVIIHGQYSAKYSLFLQCQKCDHAHNCSNHREHCHHTRLGPSAQLKMMVDRCHFEDTFSMCCLEISYLDDNGKYLNQIDQTYNQDK